MSNSKGCNLRGSGIFQTSVQVLAIVWFTAVPARAFDPLKEPPRSDDDRPSSNSPSDGRNKCTELAMKIASNYSMVAMDRWLGDEYDLMQHKLMRNLEIGGKAIGAIPAARSSNPNNSYAFHWTRDAGLVIDPIVTSYQIDSMARARAAAVISDFVNFSKHIQATSHPGDAKVELSGNRFGGPWNNPQNDGAAIVANSLIRHANRLIEEGQSDYVRRELYDSAIPAQGVVKRYLEYSAHLIPEGKAEPEKSFDPWEEEFGHHFFTTIVNRRAMDDGSSFAHRLGDHGAGNFYKGQADKFDQFLNRFWDPAKRRVVVTLPGSVERGHRGKYSLVDAQVILGFLHGASGGRSFGATDSRSISTVHEIIKANKNLYHINRSPLAPVAEAIGRYPEDVYDGVGMSSGGAWPLLTAATAEFHYRLKKDLQERRSISVDSLNREFYENLVGRSIKEGTFSSNDPMYHNILGKLIERGDRFLLRVKLHAQPNGSLNEQIRGNDGPLGGAGSMSGPEDLTWNYAAMMTAIQERQRATRDF